jgi:RNA polymerase-associated protein RTF1
LLPTTDIFADNKFKAEWNRYKKTCEAENVPIPKKPVLARKIDDINNLVKRHWTELELLDKLDRQNKLRVKYSGVERDRLEKHIADARARGNEERAAKLQAEFDKLEVPRLAFKTSLNLTKKKEDKGPSQQDLLAKLNAENRRRTIEAVRKAQLKELTRSRDLEMKLRNSEASEDGPNRLKDGKKGDKDKGKDTLDSGTSTPGAASQVLPHIAKLQEQQRQAAKGGLPKIHRPLMDDDIIGALDLDIDVEI